jgi:predicted dehydrogenase
MALKKSDAIAAVSLAKRRGLVLMEGVKTAYCPGFAALLSVARSGVIGEVKDAEACFTKLIPGGAVRERTGADAGAFRELASYPLLAIAKIFGTAPLSARFDSLADESGADGYTKAYFRFKGGFASLKVGISVKSEGELILSGTKGYILVKAPWWKTESFDVRYEDVSRNETFRCAFLGDGLRYEIADFRAAVGGDAVARGKLTEAEMVFMADMMERFSAFEGETAGRRREGRGETACTII